jgi:hypothetical protein
MEEGDQTMHKLTTMAILAGLFACTAGAEEKPAKSHIISLGLFKNGLAVVKRTVSVPGIGTYRVEDVPEPIHGTYWIESNAKVVTQLTSRVVDAPARGSAGVSFQEELVGKQVVIYFTDGRIPPATGEVEALQPVKGEAAWDRTYQRPRYYYGSRGQQPAQQRFLILRNKDGRSYVDLSRIAYLQAKGAGGMVKRRKPVLLFAVSGNKAKPATIHISYLAKGMAWAPSYRVDISDPKELVLQQKAVIKNELEGVNAPSIHLISGFPSVQFGHVTSPLSLRTSWVNFFNQLNQRPGSGHASLSNTLTQQVVMNVAAPGRGLDLSAVPAGEGVDLHYQDIGKHKLAEGDSLAVDVASGKAAYDRIVEWIVPDTRDANGRYTRNNDRDAAWDAVRFKNPLGFPMTTGPAMVVANGHFNGQRLSYWVNAGEETTLHITKALSIRTRSVEHEEEGKREVVYVGGRRFRKTNVKGQLRANNHRKETITLVVRRRFSGDLLEADRSPKCTLLEEGVYSVNKRNELLWSLKLKPGEEVKLTYRYSVLVYH